MSGATAAVYGRLGQEPRSRTTRTGTPMTTASLAVDVPDRSPGAEQGAAHTWWVNVVAFGAVAEDLARCGKGQCVSVSGRVQWSRYALHSTGEEVEAFGVVADTIVSAASQRPRGGRRRQATGDRQGHSERGQAAMWPGFEVPDQARASRAASPVADALPF